MAGGADIIAAVTDLDWQMFRNWQAYSTIIMDAWSGFSGNPGQITIVREHLLPVATQHLVDAMNLWPYGATPDDYYSDMMGAYDTDVLDRAFSDTINNTYEAVQDYHTEADNWQHEHEQLVAILGDVWPPHSVSGFKTFYTPG